MLTQPSVRRREGSASLSKIIMRSDMSISSAIASVVSLAPPERCNDASTFLGNVLRLAESRTIFQTLLPESCWVHALTSTGPSLAGGRVFPSAVPTRADVYHTASSLDQLLSECQTQDKTDVFAAADVLILGIRECGRIGSHHTFELGILLEHLAASVRDTIANAQDVIESLKQDLVVARSFDPAERIREMQELLFMKEVEAEALKRETKRLRTESERLEALAATAVTWKKARDDLAACLLKLSRRNAKLLEIEEARLKAEMDAARLAVVAEADSEKSSEQLEFGAPTCDRAIQCTMDSGYDSALAQSIRRMTVEASATMDTIEQLCAPFYGKSGLVNISRPGALAVSKLDELARRALESDSKALTAKGAADRNAKAVIAPVLSKQTVSQLLTGCEEVVTQVKLRVTALSERTDIRKLAYPLSPPTSPNEACPLCSRTDIDPALLQASREVDSIRSQLVQQSRAIELLQAERVALHDELERANARLLRRREFFSDAESLTDPITFSDGSPPLQINLIINSAPTKKAARQVSVLEGDNAAKSPSKSVRLMSVANRLMSASTKVTDNADPSSGDAALGKSTNRVAHQPQPPGRGGPGARSSIFGGDASGTFTHWSPAPRGSVAFNGALEGDAGAGASESTHSSPKLARTGSLAMPNFDESRSSTPVYTAMARWGAEANLPSKPPSWALKHLAALWKGRSLLDARLKRKSPTDADLRAVCQTLVVEYFKSLHGDKRLVAEAVATFHESLVRYSKNDNRFATFLRCISGDVADAAFTAALTFHSTLDSIHAVPADVRKSPALVPVATICAAMAKLVASADSLKACWLLMLRHSTSTANPCPATVVAAAVERLEAVGVHVDVPQDVVYRRIALWKAHSVMCNLAMGAPDPFAPITVRDDASFFDDSDEDDADA